MLVRCVLVLCCSVCLVFGQATREEAEGYASQGLTRKAAGIYASLLKQSPDDVRLHTAYVDLLLSARMHAPLRGYLKSRLRARPMDWRLHVDMLRLLLVSSDKEAFNKYMTTCLGRLQTRPQDAHHFGYHLSQYRMYEPAIEVYTWARARSQKQDEYALPLANLYASVGNPAQALKSFFAYLKGDASRKDYVLDWLKRWFKHPAERRRVGYTFREQVRLHPDRKDLGEVWLAWLTLNGDYKAAYAAATYLDKSQGIGAFQFLALGKKVLDAHHYQVALGFFEYAQSRYGTTPAVRHEAQYYAIATREAQLKAQRAPYHAQRKLQVDSMIALYATFIKDVLDPTIKRKAQHRLARLYMLEAQRPDTARQLLEALVRAPASRRPHEQDRYRLDLADAYLFLHQPWEAVLLYAQVERTTKDPQIGEEAKWRRAQAYYYQGDFELARAQLDILEQSSEKRIANDALALSYLIKIGTMPTDTTFKILNGLARVDLALKQYQLDQTPTHLETLLRQSRQIAPDLMPYVLARKAEWAEAVGEHQQAIAYWHEAEKEGRYLKDYACFRRALIFHERLQNPKAAIKTYQRLLRVYPGSIHTSEARRRWEALMEGGAL